MREKSDNKVFVIEMNPEEEYVKYKSLLYGHMPSPDQLIWNAERKKQTERRKQFNKEMQKREQKNCLIGFLLTILGPAIILSTMYIISIYN